MRLLDVGWISDRLGVETVKYGFESRLVPENWRIAVSVR